MIDVIQFIVEENGGKYICMSSIFVLFVTLSGQIGASEFYSGASEMVGLTCPLASV
jgi:hypothetical protein